MTLCDYLKTKIQTCLSMSFHVCRIQFIHTMSLDSGGQKGLCPKKQPPPRSSPTHHDFRWTTPHLQRMHSQMPHFKHCSPCPVLLARSQKLYQLLLTWRWPRTKQNLYMKTQLLSDSDRLIIIINRRHKIFVALLRCMYSSPLTLPYTKFRASF